MTTGERLHHYLERFFALRQHHGDARFDARLARLRALQQQRLRTTHADLLTDPKLAGALNFLLGEIYGGADLAPVARDIQRALPAALKLLPDKVMATAAAALEAAIITQELDEALVDTLDARLDQPLTLPGYAEGYLELGHHAERARQLDLIRQFGESLERYIRSKLLLGTFKLVKKPAHKAGFGHLYDFMAQCFAVMQPVPDAAVLLAELCARETVIMQKLFAGNAAPFAPVNP